MNSRNILHWITMVALATDLIAPALPGLVAAVPALIPVATAIGAISTIAHAIIKKRSGEGLSLTNNSYHADEPTEGGK